MNKLIFIFIVLCYFLKLNNAFQSDDEIIVLYLEAPLFYSKYGTLLANINAFHSGLGFYTLNSNESHTIDFVADPGVLQSVLPEVVENGEVYWNSSGVVQFADLVQFTGYWTSIKEVMKIDSTQFDAFVCWAESYGQSFDFYQLFDVVDTANNDTYIKSTVCNDFVWEGINTLYNLGGRYINETTVAKRDIVTMFSTEAPVIVENGSTNPLVVQFYESMLNISNTKNQTVDKLIDELSSLFQGVFYLYRNQVYYNISLAKVPINFVYAQSPLANGTRDLSNIPLIGDCWTVVTNNDSPNNRIGGGWIFIIILVSLISVYMVGGVLINKLKNNKSGLDLIPNKESWSSFGSLISDGCGFIKSKITGNHSTSGYSLL